MTDDSQTTAPVGGGDRIELPGGYYISLDPDYRWVRVLRAPNGLNHKAWTTDEMDNFVTALARPAADGRGDAGVAAGWKLVPVEPTPEMIAAIRKRELARRALGNREGLTDSEAYRAMVDAAPPPPASEGGVDAGGVDAMGEVVASMMRHNTLDHYRRERTLFKSGAVTCEDATLTGYYEGCYREAEEMIDRLRIRGFLIVAASTHQVPVPVPVPEVLGDAARLKRSPNLDDIRALINNERGEPERSDFLRALDAAATPPPAPEGLVDAVRPEVYAFALLMERELRANDHKPGWKEDDIVLLADRVWQETEELRDLVSEYEVAALSPVPEPWKSRVASEAADVANMAMMVADVCGCLDATLSGQTGGAVPAGDMVQIDWKQSVEVVFDGGLTLFADVVEPLDSGSAVVCYGDGSPGQRNRVMVFRGDGSPQAPRVRNINPARARLTAQPGGNSADPRLSGLEHAERIADHWHQRFMMLQDEDRHGTAARHNLWAMADGAKHVLDDIKAERARLVGLDGASRDGEG